MKGVFLITSLLLLFLLKSAVGSTARDKSPGLCTVRRRTVSYFFNERVYNSSVLYLLHMKQGQLSFVLYQ